MRIISRLHSQGVLDRNRALMPMYIASLFLALHYYLFMYVNSAFLGSFFSPAGVSILFALGAALCLIALLSAETVLEEIPLRRAFAGTIAVEAIGVGLLASAHSPAAAALGFILQQGAIGFASYLLDVALEREMKSNEDTGEARGIFLTAANVALVAAPIIAGIILAGHDFRALYLCSLIFLACLIPLHFSSRLSQHIVPRHHEAIPKGLRLGIFLGFLLQFFYAWMVVWSPVYLLSQGFAWQEIGLMFSIMLLPFALFELPLGELSDHLLSEKTIMAGGFALAGAATAGAALIGGPSFVLWTLALFAGRSGAAAIEIATESYFFRHVSGSDTGVIGIFRMARPVSFIIGPALGALAIWLFGWPASFAILGTVMFAGAFLAMRLSPAR